MTENMEQQEMKIKCSFGSLMAVDALKPHTHNRNFHPDKQIKMLAELLKFQGWRHPIVVSRQTGMIVAGHGRLQAAKANGWKQVPVDFQDFDSWESEYAFVQSDNASSFLAELDMSGINQDLASLDGMTFNIDMLGIPDFKVDPPMTENGSTGNVANSQQSEEPNEPPKMTMVQCPNCEVSFELAQAKKSTL